MSSTVTYKGSTLTTVDNQTRVLETSGKYLEDDITIVDVTGGGSPTLQTKTKSYTPSETAQSETVTYDSGYDGLDEVSISVGAISSTYVGSGITQRDSSDLSASGATVTAPSGYYASSATKTISSGSATPASSISATGASVTTGTNTLTLSKSSVANTPQVSAGYISSGTQGNSSVSLSATVTTKGATTYYPGTSNQTINASQYLTGIQTINAVSQTNLSAENIKSGTTISISNGNGNIWSVTGSYTGGGGSSKNVQIVQQNNTRITATSYTKACGDITVSKTGTYDIYWTAYRTSSSGTWGTQLYIGSSAYGNIMSTFQNSYFQTVHLTGVSLTQNDVISVYGRSRGSNYYLYVGQLTIIES